MVNTVDQAFIKQFESEVHLVFQKEASRMKNTCRIAQVQGSEVRWQVMGKGAASTKGTQPRHHPDEPRPLIRGCNPRRLVRS